MTDSAEQKRLNEVREAGVPWKKWDPTWVTLCLYKMERKLGQGDISFLERRYVFAGGFLGLDNIGIFDRSVQLPTGGSLEQADGTAWMAFYCQCMLEMALILSEYNAMYEEVAFKFIQHFMSTSTVTMERGLGQPPDRVDRSRRHAT